MHDQLWTNLVGFEEHFDSSGQSSDGGVLGAHESRQVELNVADLNAALGQISGLGHVVVVGVVQERLGRNAAHVQAGAAQGGVLLNAVGLGKKKGKTDEFFPRAILGQGLFSCWEWVE